MDVFVFKTNVTSPSIGEKLIHELIKLLPVFNVTIDLEDRDKVLRLESNNLRTENVIVAANKIGIQCRELNW